MCEVLFCVCFNESQCKILSKYYGELYCTCSLISWKKPGCRVSLCLAAQSCPALCDTLDYSLPGSSVHGIFQVQYRNGLQFSPPADLPNPGMESGSPALQADPFPAEPSGEAPK